MEITVEYTQRSNVENKSIQNTEIDGKKGIWKTRVKVHF